jgi:hypothetical protein
MALAAVFPSRVLGQALAETWLDRPLVGWAGRGAPIPTPPPGTGESQAALRERCDLTLPAMTDAERALADAGWMPFRYFDRQLREHDIEIVGGLTGSDGMCRPIGFNVFVVVGGRFAGTLSPVNMDSRTDGVSGAIRILSADRVAVEYARYGQADALCCPSSRVTVTFRVDRSGSPPVIIPIEIRTTRGY